MAKLRTYEIATRNRAALIEALRAAGITETDKDGVFIVAVEGAADELMNDMKEGNEHG